MVGRLIATTGGVERNAVVPVFEQAGGGETPPQPAGEDACATFAGYGRTRYFVVTVMMG